MANQNAISFITAELVTKDIDAFVFDDLSAILSALSVPDKRAFENSVKRRKIKDIGDLVYDAIREDITAKASASAAILLADNTLSSAEIDQIF